MLTAHAHRRATALCDVKPPVFDNPIIAKDGWFALLPPWFAGIVRPFGAKNINVKEKLMQIQVNTDDNVEGREALAEQIKADIRDGLSRFADQITRVEVHLSDEAAGKGGSDDKRCLLEVRPTGQQPVAVTHQGGSLQEASAGAIQKMQRKLESSFGRQNTAKGGGSIRDLDAI